jgi:uncharacterized protein YcbK (DUF882 family)
MLTADNILMGRDKAAPLTSELKENLEMLLEALNKFRAIYGKSMIVSSGYRPSAINAATKGAAKHSNHMICLAADIKDIDGCLDTYCVNNIKILEQCGLWLENPDNTPGWCHLQCVPPKSGNRIFIP